MRQFPVLTRRRGALLAAGLGITAMFAVRLIAASPEESGAESGLSRVLPVHVAEVSIEDGYMARRSFTGRVVAGRQSALAFEQGGTLADVKVDLGYTVKKGDVIARLDTARLDASLAQLKAERAEADASLELANVTLTRAEDMFRNGHVSAQRLDEAKANHATVIARLARVDAAIRAMEVDLSKAALKAPFDATITARYLDEGVIVGPGAPVLELTENGRIEAHIGMPQENAEAIAAGAPFELFDGMRRKIEGATVRGLVPVITGQTRTMLVTFDLPQASAARGELINAVIEDRRIGSGSWLPLRAITADVRGLWRVFKVTDSDEGKEARIENVQVLYTDGDRVFVTGSIANGDLIIADGTERLAPGQRVEPTDAPAQSATRDAASVAAKPKS